MVELEDFKGFEFATDELEKIMEKNANKLTDMINSDTHKYGWKNYVDTWKFKKRGDQEYLVYSTNTALPHLLEKGHLIANSRGGTGWASARPHIFDNFRVIRDQYLKEIENADLIKVKE